MRAFHLIRPGELRLETTEVPALADGELLARVDIALTCGTDLKTFDRGHARLKVPGLLGHEWAGTVQSVGGGVRSFRPGERIVATPTAPCGEYVLVPRHVVNRNAFRIPDSVSDLRAAFLEPLACTVHGADLVRLSGEHTVVFIGDGPISLLFLQVAGLRGAGRTVLVGRHAARLDVARRLGADVVINTSETDAHSAVRTITDDLGADTVVECVGRPEAWVEAVSFARRGGEVLLFGGCEAGVDVTLDTERIHYDEITLRGGFHYTPDSVRRAWDLICAGRLELEALVTQRMSLDELPTAFERMRRREALKVAIEP
jgi:L-iditol 2-dehydrogenase